mmetsp:Transcript_8673/g.21672  ORF Transcript_8673/g.21672 Transcript_8673/m.21672 type:complete len:312 (+) Transcript_8673:1731-2666(+)
MVDKPGADTARFPGAAATATDAFGRDVREGASASAVLSFKAGCSSSSCSKSAGCWLALLPRTGLCCTEFWLARERGVWEKEAEEGRGLRLLEPAPPSLPKLLAFPAWRESCCSELVRWMPAGCNGLKCTRSLGRWGLSFRGGMTKDVERPGGRRNSFTNAAPAALAPVRCCCCCCCSAPGMGCAAGTAWGRAAWGAGGAAGAAGAVVGIGTGALLPASLFAAWFWLLPPLASRLAPCCLLYVFSGMKGTWVGPAASSPVPGGAEEVRWKARGPLGVFSTTSCTALLVLPLPCSLLPLLLFIAASCVGNEPN